MMLCTGDQVQGDLGSHKLKMAGSHEGRSLCVTKSPVEDSLPDPGIHGLKGDKLSSQKIHELLRHCPSDTEIKAVS